MFAKYRITFEDGKVIEPTGRKADAIRFERHFKLPASAMFTDDGIRQEHLWFYGWTAARRLDPDTIGFDDWIDLVESVEIVLEEDPNPTTPSSSPSL